MKIGVSWKPVVFSSQNVKSCSAIVTIKVEIGETLLSKTASNHNDRIKKYKLYTYTAEQKIFSQV